MLNKSASYIANKLLLHKIISEDMLDIYVYGFELLISFLFSTSVILITGIIAGKIVETLTFLIVFILMRSFTGGYHALTYWLCTIVTLSVYVAVLLLAYIFSVGLIAYCILFVCGSPILFFFSPVENPNKQYSQSKKRKYQIVGLAIFSAAIVCGSILETMSPLVSGTVFFTLLADIAMLFPKNHQKGDTSNAQIS